MQKTVALLRHMSLNEYIHHIESSTTNLPICYTDFEMYTDSEFMHIYIYISSIKDTALPFVLPTPKADKMNVKYKEPTYDS